MRADIQEIFKKTPHDKQVMMFSATLSKDIRPVCKKFMTDPMEIYVDDEAKLTLHGLVQHYIKLAENEKNRKLTDLLDALDFNQVVIFVKSVNRAAELNKLLIECNFPSICIHARMTQEERLTRYRAFKEGHKRILVATDLVGRGIDIERVNIVISARTRHPRALFHPFSTRHICTDNRVLSLLQTTTCPRARRGRWPRTRTCTASAARGASAPRASPSPSSPPPPIRRR